MISFKLLYGLVILRRARRRLVGDEQSDRRVDNTPLEEIQGLNEMAVRVDCEHAGSSSIGFSSGGTQRP
jgi:hypothetical protein